MVPNGDPKQGAEGSLSHLMSLELANPTVKEGISYLSALGITSQTEWEDVTEDDAPEVATTVAKLCGKFLNALPVLLPLHPQ